eukprot:CAMPEP_0177646904 /NCGR_PEP_ID=MMETSP0447-20121125/10017_1 /TAXON_ID=0 /ORGANISM="Stygamoeba regulata, Strain BSH-02190019" /LENGTH=169 /DNA_ID=CAMNT_0019149457 /DNA_START=47 /DNA_END=556 /DNA_ORIENTATION=-
MAEETASAPAPVVAAASKKRNAVTVKDVPAQDFVKTYASYLKKSGKITLPKWTDVVKTACHKELAPTNPDWFYIRAASLARKVYVRSGTGVGRFRKAYGSRERRGSQRSHRAIAAGGVIRSALAALQDLKVVELDPKGGRKITSHGQRELDRIAGRIAARRAAIAAGRA